MRYEIKGETLPVVICHLESGERMVTESGGMAWMSPNMRMETSTNGGIGKAFGRIFSGDSIFQNVYTAMGGAGMIAFASSFPGSIRPFDVAPGQQIVVDTGHLAAMSASCRMDIQTVPGVKNMFFGGEGLFNTVITGPGHVWLQTMPASAVAGALLPYLPVSNH